MTCTWTRVESEGWVTSCGLGWLTWDPEEYAITYCPRCSGRVASVGTPVSPGLARACRIVAKARIEELPSGGAESASVEVVVGPCTIRVRGDGTILGVTVSGEAPRLVASGSGALREVERG